MSNLAASQRPGSYSSYIYPAGYDQTKLGLGPLMIQNNDAGTEGKWVGPQALTFARPVEVGLLMPSIQPHAIAWSAQYDWVCFADNAAASATRRFALWRFDKTIGTGLNAWSFVGAITCSIPFAGTQNTYVNNGHRLVYAKYTTGNASTTLGSTAVVGAGGSLWTDERIFQGSRIGFGSTDPTQITTWYEVASVTTNTAIVLTQNFATASLANVPYVIEDLRVVFCMYNASTLSNSGVFMVPGLRYDTFTPAGTAIAAAATTDLLQKVYWLSDGTAASNGTNQHPGGLEVDAFVSWTSQTCYMHDANTASSRFQVNNFRAAMTVGGTTAGRTAATGVGSTFTWNTGSQAVTGTVSQVANLVLCTPGAGGGPRSGVKSVFWVTTSRIYSAIVANLTNGSTTFQAGQMTEFPPGTTTEFALTAGMNTIAYDATSDQFLVLTTGATAFQHYFTSYNEAGNQMNRIICTNTRMTPQTTMGDANTAVFYSVNLVASAAYILNGRCYLASVGTSATTNFIYMIPIGVDWEYAASSGCRVVFPVMSTVGFAQFVAAYFNGLEIQGEKTGYNLGQETGAVRMYYRTTGFTDATTGWTLLDGAGDMTSVGGTASIQFMLEFRILNLTCLPGRVTRVCIEGTGTAMDPHFQASQKNSSVAGKIFAFRYSTAFGTTVPTLYVHIVDGVTGSVLVTDNSISQSNGTWQKSTDGGSTWGAMDQVDRGVSETVYFKFVPTSIADNVNALAWVALA